MEKIAHLFAGMMTIPVFIPFAAFALIYFILIWKKKSRKDALTLAVNVTTFFLIAAVTIMHGLIREEPSMAAIWWVLLFFLLTSGGVSFLQYKVKGKVNPEKLIRAVWRLAFVFFSIAYFILFISSIAHFLQLT